MHAILYALNENSKSTMKQFSMTAGENFATRREKKKKKKERKQKRTPQSKYNWKNYSLEIIHIRFFKEVWTKNNEIQQHYEEQMRKQKKETGVFVLF